MNKLLINFLILGSLSAFSKVIKQGSYVLNFDYSLSRANELWKDDDQLHAMQDTQTGSSKVAYTQFQTYGVTGSIGLPWDMQLDLRLEYRSSVIRNGQHPNEKAGAEDAAVSGISDQGFMLKKELWSFKNKYWLDGGIGYSTPADTSPDEDTFIAISDYAAKTKLAVYNKFKFGNWYFDLNVTRVMRSATSDLSSEGYPADQTKVELYVPVVHGGNLTLTTGLVMVTTDNGPDIGDEEWAELVGDLEHPPFYAAKEAYNAFVVSINYVYKPNHWIYAFNSDKFWGRNTDRSRTMGIGYGVYF